MSSENKPRLRLFLTADLSEGAQITLQDGQAHYLSHVMRAQMDEAVLLFNGRDGEWLATITALAKRTVDVRLNHQTRPQTQDADLWLLAAPIKRDRVDLVAEKASELGVSALWPVFTQHTIITRVNTDRLSAHLLEAAEQCERLTVPKLIDPAPLDKALAQWDLERIILYLDEMGGQPIAGAVKAIPPGTKLAVLIGPEGGFSTTERAWLRGLPMVRPVTLGIRILRADTAAMAALSIIQALHYP